MKSEFIVLIIANYYEEIAAESPKIHEMMLMDGENIPEVIQTIKKIAS
jgi:hypothetical protein